jgi:superfamily II DNA or RNA helicase
MVEHLEYKEYQDELNYQLTNSDRLDWMAAFIAKIGKTGNTLVLINRIEPGVELASRIPGAVFLSGATHVDDRKEHYNTITPDTYGVTVATFGIAAVGIDVPALDNIVLIEPGKSFVRTIQSIGRGLRLAAGKNHADIYDICSTMKYSKRHLTQRKAYYKEANYGFTVKKHEWIK